jgi:hypothetical protein
MEHRILQSGIARHRLACELHRIPRCLSRAIASWGSYSREWRTYASVSPSVTIHAFRFSPAAEHCVTSAPERNGGWPVLFLVGSAKPGRMLDSVAWRYLCRMTSIVWSSAFNNSIHRRATDPELLGDRSGTESLSSMIAAASIDGLRPLWTPAFLGFDDRTLP